MSTQLDEQDSTSEEEDFALDTDTTDSTQTMYEASPFNHQVGGHGPVVMLIGTNFVAKPLDAKKKEQRFYQTLCTRNGMLLGTIYQITRLPMRCFHLYPHFTGWHPSSLLQMRSRLCLDKKRLAMTKLILATLL
eukprot:m.246235 g.246235  ORF g.246235 m.246235 type:complete len:134 (-) comp33847_c0_seq2:930-1331(-)